MKYDVRVNGVEGQFTLEGDHLLYESGEIRESDVEVKLCGERSYSILLQGRSYTAEVLPGGEVIVNGRTHLVMVFDPRGLRARGLASLSGGQQVMSSPMPGRVIRVLVETGGRVEPGQGLIVVEAMKMQNEMKSPVNGTVTEVRTREGDAVAAGQVLIVIEAEK